eukprot:TRINITY_DN6520_c0_g1_i5.p2 TRINITY_DN6520_c0_g1~~TRINITY_DN6520_c0_g1_i5.p2  ORF type:complete len:265 (-),score=40.17 TRINITY_DN6520_c0_g1_i5:260-1054(-)
MTSSPDQLQLLSGTMSFTIATSGVRAARVVKGARGVAPRAAAADRPLWNPGSTAPEWLDGSLAGDYGFDPLGLGSDPDALKYFVQAELVHGRFAMLGAAGIVIPGLLTKLGVLSVPEWYKAGEVSIKESGIPLGALLVVQILLMGWVEGKRIQDFKNPGSQADGSFMGITDGFKGQGNGYPGGLFDPMGMDSPTMKQKEVKNGRLAMLACVGFVAQYKATGKGPMDNLFDHMANPGMVNFATNGVSIPHPPALSQMCLVARTSG